MVDAEAMLSPDPNVNGLRLATCMASVMVKGFRPDLVTGGVEFVQIGVSSGDKTAAGDSTVVWT